MEPISSNQNPLLKRVRAVATGRESGLLLLEGDRLVDEALRQGLAPDVLLVHTWNGEPLPREHGGPVRMITHAGSTIAASSTLRGKTVTPR